jgi:hypothetical protein
MQLTMLAMALLSPLRLGTQQSSAGQGTIGGQVVSQVSHAPIPAAVVSLTATVSPPAPAPDSGAPLHLTAIADSTGRFAFRELAPGTYRLEIRAVGYAEGAWRLRVGPGRQVDHAFDLEPLTVPLPPVVVEGERGRVAGRLADFERRRSGKMGYFITTQDIDRLNASNLADVLGTVRGVKVDCSAGVCIPRMARSQPGCEPQYFIDGVEASPYFARNTPPQDIVGLEVYRGPSELPAEFTGSNSGCGVIVIWTRSSP